METDASSSDGNVKLDGLGVSLGSRSTRSSRVECRKLKFLSSMVTPASMMAGSPSRDEIEESANAPQPAGLRLCLGSRQARSSHVECRKSLWITWLETRCSATMLDGALSWSSPESTL